MRVGLWIIMLLVGFGLMGGGGALTQMASTKAEARQVMINDVTLEIPGNVSLSVPLGLVQAGSRVEARFTSTPAIQFTTVQTETGRPIEGMMEVEMGTTYIGEYVKLAPLSYDLTQNLDLTVIVSIPAVADQPDPQNPYTSATISYLAVYVFPQTIYPYTNAGAGLAVGGLVIMIAGAVLQRKARV